MSASQNFNIMFISSLWSVLRELHSKLVLSFDDIMQKGSMVLLDPADLIDHLLT